MSEVLPNLPSQERHRASEKPIEDIKLPERVESSAKHPEHHPKARLEVIQHSVEHQARSRHEILPRLEEQPESAVPTFVNRELKDMAYQRLLTRARKQLGAGGRLVSRIIHQPVVDVLSTAAARTVGRPPALLGAGLVGFAGSTAYYYLTRHFGYSYSFTVFLLLLAAGFAAGLALDLAWRLLTIKRRNKQQY